MRRVDATALLVVIGAFALVVGRTDVALLYVRPSSRLWLTLAGVALLALGVAQAALLVRDRRATEADGTDPDEGHRLGRVGWLLVVPVAIAVAVGANPLGSYAAGRQNGERTLPAGEFDLEQHLRAGSFAGQAPALRVLDFLRAADDPDDRSLLLETPVRLTGFVTHDADEGDPHHFLLTRFTIGCCAADAIALFVQVEVPDHALPEADAWVEVEGVLLADPWSDDDPYTPDRPRLEAREVRAVEQPTEVYEYPP